MPHTNPRSVIENIKAKLGKDLFILGHHYQTDEVIRHVDKRGDSLALAQEIPHADATRIVFCGVYFMAESAAILTKPGQEVYIPETRARCVMAAMAPAPLLKAVLDRFNTLGRKIIPLTYVNSSAAIKAVCGEMGGSVCTSSNAKKMLTWALDQGDAVLFLPDKNLGRNTANQLGIPESERHILDIRSGGTRLDLDQAAKAKLLLWPGCCAIHHLIKLSHIQAARRAHPDAIIAVHPECSPEVVQASDVSGSTTTLIKCAKEAPAGGVVYVGTEIHLVRRLAEMYKGEKTIIPLGEFGCSNMAKTTETNLAELLTRIVEQDPGLAPVRVAREIAEPARLALNRMLEVSG